MAHAPVVNGIERYVFWVAPQIGKRAYATPFIKRMLPCQQHRLKHDLLTKKIPSKP
jgi:hypothetical protein